MSLLQQTYTSAVWLGSWDVLYTSEFVSFDGHLALGKICPHRWQRKTQTTRKLFQRYDTIATLQRQPTWRKSCQQDRLRTPSECQFHWTEYLFKSKQWQEIPRILVGKRPEGPLLCSRQPANGSCPKPHESSTHPHTFKNRFNIIPPLAPWQNKRCLPFRFLD